MALILETRTLLLPDHGLLQCLLFSILRLSDGILEIETGKKNKDEEVGGPSFDHVRNQKGRGFTTKWGPVGFKKVDHPLAIMVKTSSLKTNCRKFRVLLHARAYVDRFARVGSGGEGGGGGGGGGGGVEMGLEKPQAKCVSK